MTWTFRKRKKILPGIHMNYGSSGISFNIGIPGASITIGNKGVYANAGLPGTGIRNRKKISTKKQENENIDTDYQLTEKDYKVYARARNILYVVCKIFSYLFVGVLYYLTISFISEPIFFVILGIITLLFIINTIRLQHHHRRVNNTSRYLLPIILNIYFIMSAIILLGVLYLADAHKGYGFSVLMIIMLGADLFYCLKYRITKNTLIEKLKSRDDCSSNTSTCAELKEVQTAHNNIPSISHTWGGLFSFKQLNTRKELEKVYSPELLDICQYIINSEKCVLSDIEMQHGVPYAKVINIIKLLEQAHIIKQEGNRRTVIVCDEDIAIRLLLRYAKENASQLISN